METIEQLAPVFPYHGSKSKVAAEVWRRFGNPRNFIDPFFGGGAVLLARPRPFEGEETVNDRNGFVANFWRATSINPGLVAEHADNPRFENELHAWHAFLYGNENKLRERLEGDPTWYDATIAGRWAWLVSISICGKVCGKAQAGPWVVENGKLIKKNNKDGIKRSRQHLSNSGGGLGRQGLDVPEIFAKLFNRLRNVRVTCRDWKDVCSPLVMRSAGADCAVFLDPPYQTGRSANLYATDSFDVEEEVRQWAVKTAKTNPAIRLAFCRLEHKEAKELPNWTSFRWSARGAMANRENTNRHKEIIWFSPNCRAVSQISLFA